MAGGGDSKDNPVAINVVPMVDVIFCLCVFFMCSLKFKQLEGKFDTWLPLDKGKGGPSKTEELVQEIRIAMFWDATKNATVRKLGDRTINSDEELEKFVIEARNDHFKLGKTEVPATVDSEAKVPWRDVITVVNICKRAEISNIEFTLGVMEKG